jgi:hypothetical protein
MSQISSEEHIRQLFIEATNVLKPQPRGIDDLRRLGTKRRRARAAVIGASTALAVAAGASAIAFVRVPMQSSPANGLLPSPIVDGTDTAFEHRVFQFLPVFESQGSKDQKYAAISIDIAARTVIVHRKGGQSDPSYTHIADSYRVKLRFGDAVMNVAEHKATEAAAMAARSKFALIGVHVNCVEGGRGWGPIQICVDRVTPQAQSIAGRLELYGPGTVVLIKRGPIKY